MFFEKKVDLRSRAAMVAFLTSHYRYSTMNSWNRVSSYANKVKFHDLGLTNDQIDKAYEVLGADTNHWDEIDYPIDEFTRAMNGNYTIGSNGRSGGYLVLYRSQYESTGHLSHCRSCGQRNFKKALVPDNTNEGIIMAEVLKNGGVWTVPAYLEQSEVKALNMFDEQKTLIIQNAKIAAKDSTLGNKCGRCGAEGEDGRVNYAKSPTRLSVMSGKGIGGDCDFDDKDEWSMSGLRDHVELVRAFDEACDKIRDAFIELLDGCEVVEETVMVPQTRKVIQCGAGL